MLLIPSSFDLRSLDDALFLRPRSGQLCCWTCSHTLDELKLKPTDGKRTSQPADQPLDDGQDGAEKPEPGMAGRAAAVAELGGMGCHLYCTGRVAVADSCDGADDIHGSKCDIIELLVCHRFVF